MEHMNQIAIDVQLPVAAAEVQNPQGGAVNAGGVAGRVMVPAVVQGGGIVSRIEERTEDARMTEDKRQCDAMNSGADGEAFVAKVPRKEQ